MPKSAERDQLWKKRLGSSVRRSRDAAGMTQAELGKAAGVDWTTISKIERGETSPDFATIEAIADSFGVSIDSLVGRKMEAVPVTLQADSADLSVLDRLRALEELEAEVVRLGTVADRVGVLDAALEILAKAVELPETLRVRLLGALGS